MSIRGKYIVIEGQDGTGKSTQADLLKDALTRRGISSIHVKEPGGSPVAEAIRSVILNADLPRTPMTNLLLFTANRHELWNSVIDPALDNGVWVICTRNYWSTFAYQGYGEGMSLSVIEAITRTFTEAAYMRPDFAFILAFDNITERNKRIALRGKLLYPDTFESKESSFQETVQNAYHAIAREYNIPLLDASKTIAHTHQAILNLVDAD